MGRNALLREMVRLLVTIFLYDHFDVLVVYLYLCFCVFARVRLPLGHGSTTLCGTICRLYMNGVEPELGGDASHDPSLFLYHSGYPVNWLGVANAAGFWRSG